MINYFPGGGAVDMGVTNSSLPQIGGINHPTHGRGRGGGERMYKCRSVWKVAKYTAKYVVFGWVGKGLRNACPNIFHIWNHHPPVNK